MAQQNHDPRNLRLHSKRQIRQIARRIETFGFNVPVLTNAQGQLIAGHGCVQAAQVLGLSEIPTIELEHLDRTVRGDIVSDPFLGSGTTLIAAEGTASASAKCTY